MKALPANIVIVGGGTAGWMSACYLARAVELARQQHPNKQQPVNITLLESADISTVGVGEGSTPYLRHFFAYLGVDEKTWMQTCSATYKMGISFENWNNASADNSYFHPFFSALDIPTADHYFDAVNQRRRGINTDVNPSHYFTAAQMVEDGILPNTLSLATHIDYAYHFDAGQLGDFLKQYAKEKGVKHHIGTIASVNADAQTIHAVQLEDGQQLQAELFVDCSGFRGLLGKRAQKRVFKTYSDTLFNDAAVAIASPVLPSPEAKLQTRSIGLKHGWQWEIPLTSRTGNGYVYSTQFCSSSDAEAELRHVLGEQVNDSEARHLRMQVGRLEEHWQGNCVCIGLSQGFIEPLEATALMLVQYALHHFVDCWQTDQPYKYQHYNVEMNRMFDGIRDYIAAHYYLNTRTDTAYWQACRHDIKVPDTLAYLLKEWDSGANFETALNQVDSKLVYLRPSWYCILAGMQRFSNPLSSMPVPNEKALYAMKASLSGALNK